MRIINGATGATVGEGLFAIIGGVTTIRRAELSVVCVVMRLDPELRFGRPQK